MTFKVIDNKTKKAPNLNKICYEKWANHLGKYDIDQFAITEDGYLILIDDCDNLVYCPNGRFTAVETTDGYKCDYNRTNMNVENMKELMYYRKAIKILKEDDSSREVWYVGENGKTYCMRGNTVILALQQGIYRFYDTCEEAEKSKINDWIEDTQQCCSCCANEY